MSLVGREKEAGTKNGGLLFGALGGWDVRCTSMELADDDLASKQSSSKILSIPHGR